MDDKHVTIITCVLCTVIIILGMAYNSLRNENIYMDSLLEQCEAESEIPREVEKRLKKLEEAVFKQTKRK